MFVQIQIQCYEAIRITDTGDRRDRPLHLATPNSLLRIRSTVM
jgi:hypothetical protein